ncbi:MAG: MFS transporter [Chloroflexi bacterium]|nr:MFS transporter [Chloroflexota bacterium]MBP8054808.1 MFS transporter [Chloroflexota bacterium]
MSQRTAAPLVALRHRDFRLFWAGRLLSILGSQMQFTALSWHVYQLLQGDSFTFALLGRSVTLQADALGLGGLGLARFFPLVFFGLWGGILADTRNRRTLLLWTQAVSAILGGVLALLTFTGYITVPLIYFLTTIMAAATAFDNPARQAIVPNLVPKEHLTNALSLTNLMFQIGGIAGPGLAGWLIGRFNVGVVYAVDAFSFALLMGFIWMMAYQGHAAASRSQVGWQSLVEGIRFTLSQRIIRGSMVLDFWATFFSSARTMLPLVADDLLKVGVEGYGLLSTAQPLGAVVAGLVLSFRRDIRRQGLVLLVSVVIYGLATMAFGFATAFWLSFFLYALTGAADTVSTVIRNTMRQLLTPDGLRGRMTSVNMIFFMGGPQLGELEAGMVAAAFGVPVAIWTGGLATVLIAIYIARRYPDLRHYLMENTKG